MASIHRRARGGIPLPSPVVAVITIDRFCLDFSSYAIFFVRARWVDESIETWRGGTDGGCGGGGGGSKTKRQAEH
eukprot:scaffold17982_cov112-Isochrysis_galbana.AAC.1